MRRETTPQLFELHQNFPNPIAIDGVPTTGFGLTTTLRFALGESAPASLSVYDVTGRLVATLVNETLRPAEYAVRFDVRNLAAGVYFYRLVAGNQHKTRRMLIIR